MPNTNDEIDAMPHSALVPLTQAILHTWPIAQIIQLCDLASAGVQNWELWVLPHHDLIKKHSVPK